MPVLSDITQVYNFLKEYILYIQAFKNVSVSFSLIAFHGKRKHYIFTTPSDTDSGFVVID
jgi:hypothetical protein